MEHASKAAYHFSCEQRMSPVAKYSSGVAVLWVFNAPQGSQIAGMGATAAFQGCRSCLADFSIGRRDELRAAWAIFTPLLHAIDDGKLEPVEYKHGSRGPPEADELIRDAGFVRNESYVWGDSPRRSAL